MKKNNKGFTLVELIVVIVILAILIGVTIGGIYMYVGRARKNTDINNASAMQKVLSTLATNEELYAYADTLKTTTKVTSEGKTTFEGYKAIYIGWHDEQEFVDDGTKIEVKAKNSGGEDATFNGFSDNDALTYKTMKEISRLYTDGLPQHKSGGYFELRVDLRKMEGADAPDIAVSVETKEATDSETTGKI